MQKKEDHTRQKKAKMVDELRKCIEHILFETYFQNLHSIEYTFGQLHAKFVSIPYLKIISG